MSHYTGEVRSDIPSWLDGTDGCTFCEHDPGVCNDGGVCQRSRPMAVMTPEQALTRAQTLVGKLLGKHDAGSLSLDEQMELGLCWQTLRVALSSPAVPEGWKLVPVEPTREMLNATSWPGCAKTDYKHMLAALAAHQQGGEK